MKKEEIVIVINPGSTSTKYALWTRTKCILEQVVRHDSEKLAANIADQLEYRKMLIDEDLLPRLSEYCLVGVVGRGGLLKPLAGGTYNVNDIMLEDLRQAKMGSHASNLGAMLARIYADQFNVPAFIVDPVTVDEFIDLARLSGIKWIQRKSRSHALNIKAVVRRSAQQLNKHVPETNFVVAHLGGGISIAAVQGGRIIDVNDALLGMGPYSPERTGALPTGPLIEKCFSGEVTQKELLIELSRKGGLMSYCNDSDVRKLMERSKNGEKEVTLAIEGMIYQVAKEIGAMAAVLHGKIDGIVITGGLAHSDDIIALLRSYISFLGNLLVFPGEGELQALAEGAFRVIDKVEPAREYC